MPECHSGGKCEDWYKCTMHPNKADCPYKTNAKDTRSPTPLGQVDSLVKRKIDHEEYCMVCPECGHHPLTLMGERKGLTLKLTGGKAQCPVCPYEMEL